MSLKLTITTPVKVKDLNKSLTTTPNWAYEATANKEFLLYLHNNGESYHELCALSLVSLTFNKQMYRPCEIHARMEIYKYETKDGQKVKTTTTFTQAELNHNFLGAQVSLTDGSNSIASNYYVYRMNPHYIGSAFYVDFVIYSADKILTTEISSRTFVARRLGNDILLGQSQKLKLPYDDKSTFDTIVKIHPRNKLFRVETQHTAGNKGGNYYDDYIHPYLVQYNESFYDLLVRTANRWGEFVCFEGGALLFGHQGGTVTLDGTYSTYEYADDELAAKANRDTVSQDDYMSVIKKDEFIQQAGDLFAHDPCYSHKVVQSLLAMKGNVFDWAADIVINDTLTAGQNKAWLDGQKDKYNKKFFKQPLNSSAEELERINLQFDSSSSPSKYCQFSNYIEDENAGLKSSVYKDVLAYEKAAAQHMICVDYGTTYKHIQLGDTILNDEYIVTQVECTEDISHTIKTDAATGKFVLGEDRHLHFRYYAVKKTDGGYYPPMLPSGHIRTSGPQIAKIADNFDPLMKVRYRVKYEWPTETSTEASPWIPVTHEMLSTSTGSVWMMGEGSLVLLNFTEGNIERPYIVGAFQTPETSVPRATQFNTMNLQSPSGHAIRITDGYGGGASNFVASFLPVVSLIKGFMPEGNALPDYGGHNKYYEGGIELTDYFGIYSIKASTDERNISIKSPYGDVNLSAFTGITISAPNGDVKIQGKNVSIEAGNNVTITSGKNIKQGILGHGALIGRNASIAAMGLDAAKAFTKTLLEYADLSILRHALEVVLRPVAGEMKIISNRMMTLQAGLSQDDFEKEADSMEFKLTDGDWIQETVLGGNVYNDVFKMRSKDSWTSEENGRIQFNCKQVRNSFDDENNPFNNLVYEKNQADFKSYAVLAVAALLPPVGLGAIGIYKGVQYIKNKKNGSNTDVDDNL